MRSLEDMKASGIYGSLGWGSNARAPMHGLNELESYQSKLLNFKRNMRNGDHRLYQFHQLISMVFRLTLGRVRLNKVFLNRCVSSSYILCQPQRGRQSRAKRTVFKFAQFIVAKRRPLTASTANATSDVESNNENQESRLVVIGLVPEQFRLSYGHVFAKARQPPPGALAK